MSQQDALRARLLEAVDVFVAADWRQGRDTSLALACLTERPQRAAVQRIYSTEEAEERLALARQVEQQSTLHDLGLSRFQTSILLILPLPVLREAASTFHSTCLLTESLVRAFLQMGQRHTDGADSRGRSDATRVPRNRRQAEAPEVCHIFPFGATATQEGLGRVAACLPVIDCILGITGQAADLLYGLGRSDRTWNMVCLERQLHKWWALGYWGMKCLGVQPVLGDGDGDGAAEAAKAAEITLQFHWLPRQKVASAAGAGGQPTTTTTWREQAWDNRIGIASGDAAALWTEWSEELLQQPGPSAAGEPVIAAAIPASSRALLTGASATIQMPFEEALKMKAMVDLQWACLAIASMSGAAGDPSFLREWWDDGDDDDAAAYSDLED